MDAEGSELPKSVTFEGLTFSHGLDINAARSKDARVSNEAGCYAWIFPGEGTFESSIFHTDNIATSISRDLNPIYAANDVDENLQALLFDLPASLLDWIDTATDLSSSPTGTWYRAISHRADSIVELNAYPVWKVGDYSSTDGVGRRQSGLEDMLREYASLVERAGLPEHYSLGEWVGHMASPQEPLSAPRPGPRQ